MIDGLKPYPEYKDSGDDWLSQVPKHWDVRKLRNVLDSVTERNRPDLPLLSVVREKGVIVRDITDQDINHNFIPDDLTNYKVVRVGQFAMNKMKAWQGSYGVSRFEGIVSPAYFVFDIHNVEGPFFNAAIRSKAFVPFFSRASDGVRIGQWDLSKDRMREIPFAVPPPTEQAGIVRFLDYVDRRIRRYIRAKRRLIELLGEQKQAIIHQAVTRGLDPNTPLKPSGIDWLGDVPERWDVSQIRAIAQVVRGGTPRPAGSPLFFHGDAEPWITVGEITKDQNPYLSRTTSRLTEAGVERSRIVYPGTVLLTNSGATLGVPKILKIQGCINDGVAAFLRLRPDIVKEFMYFYWTTQTPHLREWVNLGAQPNLNTQIIGGWPVVVPPTTEQQAIVECISKKSSNITKSIALVQDEIAVMSEFRTRLIADVVTGKLDVREAAARLPDEVDEDAAADEPLDGELPGAENGLDEAELEAETEEIET